MSHFLYKNNAIKTMTYESALIPDSIVALLSKSYSLALLTLVRRKCDVEYILCTFLYLKKLLTTSVAELLHFNNSNRKLI